jgi:N-acetylglucosaminyldiphosphoundecaprenol N-acetyl-beta-D-mannosaminyltransferase
MNVKFAPEFVPSASCSLEEHAHAVADKAAALPRAVWETADRIRLFGMTIDRINLDEAAARLLRWTGDDYPSEGCRYVVTPNVDHAVMYQTSAPLRDVYEHAAMVTADGAPLVAVAKLLGRQLPERVAGSDLTPRLFDEASAAFQRGERRALRLFLLGAGPGVAERAAAVVKLRWPGVEPVGCYSPPMGFERDDAENARILAKIEDARPDVLLVGLGAPKQELWVGRWRARLAARVVLCAGATIDFLAGEKKRSPRWMQRVGLEWAHRLLSEPKRLARRYARDAWVFPQLVWAELRGSFR